MDGYIPSRRRYCRLPKLYYNVNLSVLGGTIVNTYRGRFSTTTIELRNNYQWRVDARSGRPNVRGKFPEEGKWDLEFELGHRRYAYKEGFVPGFTQNE